MAMPCKCAGLAGPARKARIHTGKVRRPQYQRAKDINVAAFFCAAPAG
jgi:hypothetical protein